MTCTISLARKSCVWHRLHCFYLNFLISKLHQTTRIRTKTGTRTKKKIRTIIKTETEMILERKLNKI